MIKPIPCVIPPRRDYRPVPAMVTQLPFVYGPRNLRHHGRPSGSLWYVPRTTNDAKAQTIGREYAAHFAQYLKDNPNLVGGNLLGRIVMDMHNPNTAGNPGYRTGFFTFLEKLIAMQAVQCDVFAELDRFNRDAALP